jgi:hypothetical protein
VQEKADALATAQAAQLLAERDQVIIVHPDDVVGPEQGRQPLGELPVDALIRVEGAPLEDREIDPVVEQRPEDLVRIPS